MHVIDLSRASIVASAKVRVQRAWHSEVPRSNNVLCSHSRGSGILHPPSINSFILHASVTEDGSPQHEALLENGVQRRKKSENEDEEP